MLPSTDRTSATTGTTEVKIGRIFLMGGEKSAILFTGCHVLENRRLTAQNHLLIRGMIEKEEVLKFYTMNDFSNSAIENVLPSFVKTRLADLLTLSRGLIGLVILSLSFIGEDAYIAVVILALTGAATDIFDGRAARRYLGENREGKLGKFDLEIDTLFVLCIIGYFSFSGVVIPKMVGLGWITLAVIVTALYKRKTKVLYLFEIPTILALIAVSGIYKPGIFFLIILPAICAATIINRRRVLYLIFEYIPKSFLE